MVLAEPSEATGEAIGGDQRTKDHNGGSKHGKAKPFIFKVPTKAPARKCQDQFAITARNLSQAGQVLPTIHLVPKALSSA